MDIPIFITKKKKCAIDACTVCSLLKFLFTPQEPISYINHSSFHFLTEVVNKIFTYIYAESVAHYSFRKSVLGFGFPEILLKNTTSLAKFP